MPPRMAIPQGGSGARRHPAPAESPTAVMSRGGPPRARSTQVHRHWRPPQPIERTSRLPRRVAGATRPQEINPSAGRTQPVPPCTPGGQLPCATGTAARPRPVATAGRPQRALLADELTAVANRPRPLPDGHSPAATARWPSPPECPSWFVAGPWPLRGGSVAGGGRAGVGTAGHGAAPRAAGFRPGRDRGSVPGSGGRRAAPLHRPVGASARALARGCRIGQPAGFPRSFR